MPRTPAYLACALAAVLAATSLAACSSTPAGQGRAASEAPVQMAGESGAAGTTDDSSAVGRPADDARPSDSAVAGAEPGHPIGTLPGYPIDGLGGVLIANDLPFAINVSTVDMVDGYDWQGDRPDREPPQGFVGVTIPPGGREMRMLGAKAFVKRAPFRMWFTSVTDTSSGPVMRPMTDVYFDKSYFCTVLSDLLPIPYDCHAPLASKSWAGFGINLGDNYSIDNTYPTICQKPWKRTFTFSQGDPPRTGTAEAALSCGPGTNVITFRTVSP